MKHLYVLLILSILLSSCATKVIQLHTSCKQSNEEIFQDLTSILLSSNFMIKQNDPKNGYLQAETLSEYSMWTGRNETRIWTFQIVDSLISKESSNPKVKKLISSAKLVYFLQSQQGGIQGNGTTYLNDETNKDLGWYWDVRNKIEKICSDIHFVEKKVN